MKIHDSRYKQLFSNPKMLEQLFLSFVHEDFVQHIDFSSATQLNSSFVAEDFKQTESDLIVRVRLKNSEQEIYLFLLIEFQSSPDPTMPIRVLRYLLDFYHSLPKFKQLCRKKSLPPVFPLVLYNGDRKWKYPQSVEELLSTTKLFRTEFIPKFNMNLMEVNTYQEEVLLKIKNTVSAVFLLENTDISQIETSSEKIVDLIEHEDQETYEYFIRWFLHFVGQEEVDPITFAEINRSPKMFAKKATTFVEMKREEGRVEGLAEGQRNNAIETARKMKEKGMDIQLIAEITELSEQEILGL